MASSPEAQRLASSLDRLDQVFQDVELPSDLEGCDYCWSDGSDSLRLPIYDVPYDDLVSFAMEGSDHWGAYASMLRRLLPRIARTLAEGTLYVDAAWVLSHLADAHWQEWKLHERAAVAEFLDAFFQKTLAEDPTSDLNGGEILEAVAAATGDVGPWLVEWDEISIERTGQHLEWVRRRRPHRGHSGWWPRNSEAQLDDWLPRAERRLPLN
jgi:hypothetical protein